MSYRAVKRARKKQVTGSRNISHSRQQENDEVIVVPLPKGVEAFAPMLLVPTPDGVDPERALSLIIEALTEHDGEHRADMTVLLRQLERYGNKLVLPTNGRMIASAGFFEPMRRQMEQDCPLCKDGTHTHGTHNHVEPTHCAGGNKLLPDPGSETCVIEVGNGDARELYGGVIGAVWARQVAQSFIKTGYSRVRVTNIDADTVIDDLHGDERPDSQL